MKKGILGGTFDPIHIGHLNIAYESLYKLKLDEVIFLPNGNPPHKTNNNISHSKYRLDMVKLSVEGENLFKVSSYEVDRKDVSYTYETLEYFRDKEPETEWFFITGADCLFDLQKWRNPKEILKNCRFVVFPRGGFSKEELIFQKKKIEEKFKEKITFLDIPSMEISSSAIRDKVIKNEEFEYLVGSKVKVYIKANKLYLGDNYVV
ncbi:MAG: nicotinate-nucleotide adenylyltransferase [Clostridiaceae bacterium]